MKDPGGRFTAKEFLEHPWFTQYERGDHQEEDRPKNEEKIEKFKMYNSVRKLDGKRPHSS